MSKCRRTEDNMGDDLFSQLPDNILIKFFTLLPMKEALGTCILSKKLLHLWKSIPHLDFKETADHDLRLKTDEKRWELVKIVNKFLEHRNGPIKSFRLSICPRVCNFDIGYWFNLLMKNDIEELELQFIHCPPKLAKLPSSLFSLKTLRVLKLQSCVLKLPDGFTGLSCLETLTLGDMSLPDDVLCSILSQCGHLRSLTLKNCEGFEEENIKISYQNNGIKSLTLEDCHDHIEIDAPNLETLYYRGERAKFSFKDVSNLAEVVIIRGESGLHCIYEFHNMETNILEKLVHVQSLTLTGWSFRCFAAGDVPYSLRSEYLGLVKLEVEMCFSDIRELQGLTCFLRTSKVLEELVVWINEDFPKTYYGGLTDADACGCFNYLKWVNLNNFTGVQGEVDFVDFVLNHAKLLRTITINPAKEMSLNEWLWFAEMFTPKASNDDRVVLNMVKKS